MGLVHIMCGEGKGKTTAALGLALRMAGAGGRVCLVRFLKNDDSAELRALRQVRGVTVIPCEKSWGFSWNMTAEQKREASDYYALLLHRAWNTALAACSAPPDAGALCEPGAAVLLVMDELAGAVSGGFIREKEVLNLLDHRPDNMEIAVTGRNPSEELLRRADYVTEMTKVKHPYDRGIKARPGIEY